MHKWTAFDDLCFSTYATNVLVYFLVLCLVWSCTQQDYPYLDNLVTAVLAT